MVTVTRYADGSVRLDAALDRISVMAPTLGEAWRDMGAALRAHRAAMDAHRFLRSVSTLAFDPQIGLYVADCPLGGLRATGHTRQQAWFLLLRGIEKRAEEAALAAGGERDTLSLLEEHDEQDQVRGGDCGMDSGTAPSGPGIPGTEPDPEAQ